MGWGANHATQPGPALRSDPGYDEEGLQPSDEALRRSAGVPDRQRLDGFELLQRPEAPAMLPAG